jgi:hypothetical protein
LTLTQTWPELLVLEGFWRRQKNVQEEVLKDHKTKLRKKQII